MCKDIESSTEVPYSPFLTTKWLPLVQRLPFTVVRSSTWLTRS